MKRFALPLATSSKRYISSSLSRMGRQNILNYQLEHDHETDLGTPADVSETKLVQQVNKSAFPFTLSKDSTIQDYLNNNRFFVESIKHNHSDEIFNSNSKGQSPHTLWIGCSDSRAGEGCLATLPGEVFTHRNIANIINSNDISSQGVIQFAIDVLKVKKIIVCGHTDCGGIWASLSSKKIGGVLDLWLNPVRHVRANHLNYLKEFNDDPKMKARKLAELNVIASVTALKRHPSATTALKNGEIEVWGMMYDVATGLLSEVEVADDEFEDLFHVHDEEVEEEYQAH